MKSRSDHETSGPEAPLPGPEAQGGLHPATSPAPSAACQRILDAIDDGYASTSHERPPRAYIGASIIGNECDALLALSLRGFPEDVLQPKLQRIFRLGHQIEAMVIADLRLRAGFTVLDRNSATNEQFAMQAWGGHVVAHADGYILLDPPDTNEPDLRRPHLLEIKSMNSSMFSKFKRYGLRKSHPKYYDQVQMMMGMDGLSAALVVAYNKNSSDYWCEIVAFDEIEWSHLAARIERVLNGSAIRIANDPEDWRCRTCFKRRVCHEGPAPDADVIDRACRTCQHALPTEKGGWWCMAHDRAAERACPDYTLFHPDPASPKRS